MPASSAQFPGSLRSVVCAPVRARFATRVFVVPPRSCGPRGLGRGALIPPCPPRGGKRNKRLTNAYIPWYNGSEHDAARGLVLLCFFRGSPLGQILQLSDRGGFSVLHQMALWRNFSAFSLLSPCFSYCFQYAVVIECRTMLLRGSGAAPFNGVALRPAKVKGRAVRGVALAPSSCSSPSGLLAPIGAALAAVSAPHSRP